MLFVTVLVVIFEGVLLFIIWIGVFVLFSLTLTFTFSFSFFVVFTFDKEVLFLTVVIFVVFLIWVLSFIFLSEVSEVSVFLKTPNLGDIPL